MNLNFLAKICAAAGIAAIPIGRAVAVPGWENFAGGIGGPALGPTASVALFAAAIFFAAVGVAAGKKSPAPRGFFENRRAIFFTAGGIFLAWILAASFWGNFAALWPFLAAAGGVAAVAIAGKNLARGAVLTGAIFAGGVAAAEWFFQKSVGLGALGEPALGAPGTAKFELFGEAWIRATATLPHANILAGFLAISLVAGLGGGGVFGKKTPGFLGRAGGAGRDFFGKIFRRGDGEFFGKKWPGFFAAAGIFLAGLGLFLSFSRLGIAAALAGAVVAGWPALRTLRGWEKIWLGLCAGVAGVVASVRAADFLAGAGERIAQFRAGFDGFLTAPFFGNGLGTAREIVAGAGGFFPWEIQPPHAVPAVAAVETGAVGLIFLLIFAVAGWRAAANRTGRGILVATGILAAGEHFFWTTVPGGAILGVALGIAILKEKSPAVERKSPR